MLAYDTYAPATVARHLHRAGQWDAALAVLGEGELELRAEVVVDRRWWRLDDPAQAQSALDRLDPASPHTALLRAQLAYTRLLFDREPLTDDAATAEADFRTAASDEALRGWAMFWLGVLADNVHLDPATAKRHYDESLSLARSGGDLLLESYVVRHLGGHASDSDPVEAELLLRRSLHLRAALGARPQVAAAQAALAGVLPPGGERQTLLELARVTAVELDLTGLRGALATE
jgi:hypothetical protein